MDDDPLVLVTPGLYSLVYVSHDVRFIFNGTKLYMKFQIVGDDEFRGFELYRYYNVDWLQRPNGRKVTRAGWKSDLMRDYVRLFGERPRRTDEICFGKFKDKVFCGEVVTVEQDSHGRDIPCLLQYSRVSDLGSVIEDLAGSLVE